MDKDNLICEEVLELANQTLHRVDGFAKVYCSGRFLRGAKGDIVALRSPKKREPKINNSNHLAARSFPFSLSVKTLKIVTCGADNEG